MKFEEIKSILEKEFLGLSLEEDLQTTPAGIKLKPGDLEKVCTLLRDHDQLYFDMLSCITALDNGPESNSIELIYNLYSIPFDHHLTVKTYIDRKAAAIDTLTNIWKSADWMERECYDLVGVKFHGHPDLRRILLPEDWEGHPLRKDYKEQEYYHGIKVEY